MQRGIINVNLPAINVKVDKGCDTFYNQKIVFSILYLVYSIETHKDV